MSLSLVAPDSADVVWELKRQLLSKSFSLEASPAKYVNNETIESIMQAIVVFYRAQIDEGIEPSTILFKNDALKLASWLRYHRNINNDQDSHVAESVFEELHTMLSALLDSWREEILSMSVPRPRDIFDFKVFQRTGCIWDEWLEMYRQLSYYPELYPIYADIIRYIACLLLTEAFRDYTCFHMSSLIDFFVNTSESVHFALLLARNHPQSASYPMVFLSIFLRWSLSYTMGLERTLFSFQTSSMLVLENEDQLDDLLRFLSERKFFIAYEDNDRLEFASPKLADQDLLHRFRRVTQINNQSLFGDDIVVTIFTKPKDLDLFGFRRQQCSKPLFPTCHSREHVVVTGRNTFMTKKWVYNLSQKTGIDILYLGFSENEKVDSQCRRWVDDYIKLLYCHVQLIEDGLAANYFSQNNFRFNYGLAYFCMKILYSACIQLKNYFDETFRISLWRLLVDKSCLLIRQACRNTAALSDDLTLFLCTILTLVCSAGRVISKAIQECPGQRVISECSIRDLGICLNQLQDLYQSKKASIDPWIQYDLESCIKTIDKILREKEDLGRKENVDPYPESMVCVSPHHRVYKGFDRKLGRIVVYKEIKPVQDENLITEIDFSTLLQYHDVVECYGLLVTDNATFMKMEYCPLRCMEDYVSCHGPYKSAAEVSNIGFLILRGLGFLHSNLVVHGAVTPSNVLVDVFGAVRLTDFGCSRYVAPSAVQYSKGVVHANTPFLAPETVKDGITTSASDMWGFGCILFFVMTGKYPFSECSGHLKILQMLGSSQIFDLEPLENCRKVFGDDIVDIAKSCLSVDPQNRPNSFALRFHPFFYIPYPS